jgi:hypothetical protein
MTPGPVSAYKILLFYSHHHVIPFLCVKEHTVKSFISFKWAAAVMTCQVRVGRQAEQAYAWWGRPFCFQAAKLNCKYENMINFLNILP